MFKLLMSEERKQLMEIAKLNGSGKKLLWYIELMN